MRSLIAGAVLALSVVLPAWATTPMTYNDAMLNKVTLKLNAEQWVVTKTALVTIGVSAAVNDKGLEVIQDMVTKKLTQLSPQSEWHITAFDRSLDQSGLEKVQISAEARLPFSVLSSLRDKTKGMSKPGETYTLDSVLFSPSEAELRATNILLRENIYTQAKDELDRVTKTYNEKYYVHDINFINDVGPMPVQPMFAQNKMAMVSASPMSGSLAVSNKIVLNAIVTLSAMPDQSVIKFIQ